jgi:hypothetical protein
LILYHEIEILLPPITPPPAPCLPAGRLPQEGGEKGVVFLSENKIKTESAIFFVLQS